LVVRERKGAPSMACAKKKSPDSLSILLLALFNNIHLPLLPSFFIFLFCVHFHFLTLIVSISSEATKSKGMLFLFLILFH
jgi:hypothetical protein